MTKRSKTTSSHSKRVSLLEARILSYSKKELLSIVKKNQKSEPWYAVKYLIDLGRIPYRKNHRCYEERIVVFRATSFNHALRLASASVREFARGVHGKPTKYFQAFHIFESRLGHGGEVYSEIRESELDPEKFIARYYDDDENCRTRSKQNRAGSTSNTRTRRREKSGRQSPALD